MHETCVFIFKSIPSFWYFLVWKSGRIFVRMSGTEKKLRAQYASIIKSFYRSLDKSSNKLDKMSKQVDDLRQLLKEYVFLYDETSKKLNILISKVTTMQQTIIIFGVSLILVQPKVLYWLSILLSFLKIN